MSTDSENPDVRPEPAITEPITAPAGEPEATAEPLGVPAAEQPAVAVPTTGPPAVAPAYAAVPTRTRWVTNRAPWWHYLAVGVAGMIIGTLLTLSSVAVVSHFRNAGFGDRRGQIQRFNHRPGRFGPGQYGPNQGTGPRFNGPQQVQPTPAPTTTG
jgi:hypothetical protein